MSSVCRNCGNFLEPKKFLCHKCGELTISETGGIGSVSKGKTIILDQVVPEAVPRANVGEPWDACFGGGIVWTSSTLVGGAPGSGKTTGLLQILSKLAEITGKRGYYLSAEQGPGDLRLTADRLHLPNVDRFRVLSEFGVGAEIDDDLLKEDPPCGMIVDSVSALCGKDVHAAIAIAKRFKIYAVKWKAPAFLICHMTKEHDYAGLMALQHEVDALITIFPDDDGHRHLKAWKNRNGSTHEEYTLVMTERGLVAPPPKPDKPDKKKKVLSIEADPPKVAEPFVEEPRARAKKSAPPDEIEVGGQKLVRKVKDKVSAVKAAAAKAAALKAARKAARKVAAAVEGEALKKKRPPMPKVKPKAKRREVHA